MNVLRERLKKSVNMEIAEAISKLSTCTFTQVGAIIVSPENNRIIATGYNGTPPGHVHCNNLFWDDTEESRNDHRQYADDFEIHAEMNAIFNAARNGARTEHCVLYTTVSPCKNCLKHIRASGINAVYYKERYWRLTEEDLEKQRSDFNMTIQQIKG